MELKYLNEKRAEAQTEMETILGGAKTEERALNEEEIKKFKELKKMIDEIDETIKAQGTARETELKKEEAVAEKEVQETEATAEERAFVNYIKSGKIEQRGNMTFGDNGAVIPQTIAQKIIENVKNICPIYSLAEIYNVKGTLVVPYYGDNEGENITCAYATEFTDLTSKSGKFTSIELKGYLAGALTKVSKMLKNNSDFDILNFVVKHLSEAVAQFLEKELLTGSGTNSCQGILSGATNVTTTATTGAIKADDLIDLQESVIDNYQRNAVFIMNRKTRSAIRKLKDSNGQYLLNPDFSAKWGYTLLGKPVYTTDTMPEIDAEEKAVIYGDMTGLTVKMAENVSVEVLNELYAPQHAIGVVGWVEVDSKVTDQQKLAVLEIAGT